jgi:hypothetical protein
MSEISADPVVTYVEEHWRGEWADGYAVIVNTHDDSRPGSERGAGDLKAAAHQRCSYRRAHQMPLGHAVALARCWLF